MCVEERYVNPIDCWEDTYEGLWLQKLDTEQGNKEVIDYLYNTLFKKDSINTINNLAKMQRARFSCYGQSWSKEPDSDALWRIYSYDRKGIQIISDKSRIEKLIDSQKINGLIKRIGNVDYKLDFSDPDIMAKMLHKGSKSDEAFFHKRKAFQHEKEVRVIIQLTKEYLDYTFFSAGIMISYYNLNKGSKSDEEVIFDAVKCVMNDNFKGFYTAFPKDIKIDIGDDLSKYLLGVKVHPQAEKWYIDMIRELCEQYGLTFLGKSALYSSI